ncbi:MAG: hypothetical protein ABIB47_01915 [Candidatus Woesearchaeota archaeon]
MKKITLIAVCLILMFLISACDSVSPYLPSFLKKEEKPSVGRGVRLFFDENAPPRDKILIGGGSKFLIRVGIENYGDEIRGGNFDLNLWDNIPNSPLDKHAGKDDNYGIEMIEAANFRRNELGNEIIEIFPSKTFTRPVSADYDSESIISGTKLNVFAELYIHQYDAEIATNICLKREEDPDPACSNRQVVSQNQLGKQASYLPVTIEKIEKTATHFGDNKYFVNLKVTFRNLGEGMIVPVDTRGSGEVDERLGEAIGGVKVELQSEGGSVDCSPEPLVFDNNMAVLNCFVENVGARESLVTYPLKIRYSFGYKLRAKVGPVSLVKIEDLGG